MTDDPINAVELATKLKIAWLGNQNVRVAADEVPAFLRSMHATINELASGSAATSEEESAGPVAQNHVPAVSVRKSLASKEVIISMIDGKPYKSLRRHLSANGLSPEDYRARYNLKPDYPMVSESYSEQRRALAHKMGLGAKGRQARASAPAASKPAKRAAAVKS